MDAHEHVGLPGDLALDERHVVLVVDQRAVADRLELAERRRQARRDDAFDELVVAAAVGDQVGDRDHAQPVAGAVLDQFGHPRHRAVVVHHLADHAGRVQARQAREVDGRLGLPGALEHAAGAALEREHVARLDEVARAGSRGRSRPGSCARGRARRCPS